MATPEQIRQYKVRLLAAQERVQSFAQRGYDLTLNELISGTKEDPSFLVIALIGKNGADKYFLDGVINQCQNLEELEKFVTALRRNSKDTLGCGCFSACKAANYDLAAALERRINEVLKPTPGVLPKEKMQALTRLTKFIQSYMDKGHKYTNYYAKTGGLKEASTSKKMFAKGAAKVLGRKAGFAVLIHDKTARNVSMAEAGGKLLRLKLEKQYPEAAAIKKSGSAKQAPNQRRFSDYGGDSGDGRPPRGSGRESIGDGGPTPGGSAGSPPLSSSDEASKLQRLAESLSKTVDAPTRPLPKQRQTGRRHSL